MKKTRFTDSQIFSNLKEAETGIPVAELCRKCGMSDASFYNWRAKYGDMDVSHFSPLKAGFTKITVVVKMRGRSILPVSRRFSTAC